MALILQIETATASCSVCLAENGETLTVKELSERNVHASSLTLFIADVLKDANRSIDELDAIAVSMGPGSYTGLRIGVSTVKGMCYALGVPLIAIGTLEAMAAGMLKRYAEGAEFLLCPMIDARRMEVYTSVYTRNLDKISAVEAKIIDQHSFEDLLSENRILFFGDGAGKCRETLGFNVNAVFIPDFVNSASDFSLLAFEKYQQEQFEDVAYFEPYYLKDFLPTNPGKALK